MSLGTSSNCQKQCNWHSQKKGNRDQKLFETNHSKIFFKFGEKYKPTNQRSSVKPKHKKYKENCTKAYYNQITQSKKILKASQRRKILSCRGMEITADFSIV